MSNKDDRFRQSFWQENRLLIVGVPCFLALCVAGVILHDRWEGSRVAQGRGSFTNARLIRTKDQRHRLVVVSEASGMGESFSWQGFRFDLVDLPSGKRIARHIVELKKAGNITACAAASLGLLWCHGRGVGAELRDAEALKVHRSAERIGAKLPKLATALRKARTVSVDRESGALVVKAPDNQRWSIDPRALRAKRLDASSRPAPRLVGIAASSTVRADSLKLKGSSLYFKAVPTQPYRRQLMRQRGGDSASYGEGLRFLRSWFLADHRLGAALRLSTADSESFIVSHVDSLEQTKARRLLTAFSDGRKRWEANLGRSRIRFATRLDRMLLLALAGSRDKVPDAMVAIDLDSGKELWRYQF